MQIESSHVVVTGAGSGIGAALAQRFALEGARRVVCADVDADAVGAVANLIGPAATAVVCNVAVEEENRRLIEAAEAADGSIDLFAANAGVLGGLGGAELDDDVWRYTIDVNLMAHVWMARHLVPRMVERGGGYLLHTASAAGLLTQIGGAPYSVTKHAVVAFAEWLAITYGERGVKVSVLCPQAVRTAMTAGTDEGDVAGVDGMIEPEAVAAAAVAGIATEQFLILPHPQVAEYERRRAADHDRWIAGMQRLQARYAG